MNTNTNTNRQRYISGIEYAARMLATLDQERFERPFDRYQEPSYRIEHGMAVSGVRVG